MDTPTSRRPESLTAGPGTGTAGVTVRAARNGSSGSLVEAEERTRDKVRAAVLEHGPISAAELGRLLGYTPAAVRRHLDQLERNGVIEVKRMAKPGAGAGRPARRYVISSQGQQHWGDDYLDIARTALHDLAELGGEEAVAAFAERRFAGMEERYAPLISAAGPTVEEKATALVEALNQDGFVANANVLRIHPVSKKPLPPQLAAVQLCQGHCPIQNLAAEFPVFCDKETEVFERLLGVDVRRLSTLANGGHVCTTHIPTGRNHQQERP
ncbi:MULTISPECIES: helix-turn-helix domain-containing protein [Arthrobacter]|uniref:Helix-turn-helix domain-containing protein n=3 Tax=Arthrobacter TaxID=1663 RepID=A0ABU9KH48_9MICC|nr:helix-turn-helix domain-containing protein [Arthrobacter sp. YJM1]MDP5226092.1 winged helix-turn-helix transcriptional regulator [Arthrobacter sp. YJM1]